MTTILGVLVTAVTSHLGGAALGGVLAKFGVLGFGRKIGIASHILKVGVALRNAYQKDNSEEAKKELSEWLKNHDPKNESGFKESIE